MRARSLRAPRGCVARYSRAAQSGASDTDESAYAPATLAKIHGRRRAFAERRGRARATGAVVHHHGNIHRAEAPAVEPFPAVISAWIGSRGCRAISCDMYFGGELPELQFEQGGKKYWVMAGLPGGLGFDVYPAGQKLTIYLQRVGFASGTPVAVLTLAKLPTGVTTSTTVTAGRRMRNTRMGEGARRQEATFKNGHGHVHLCGARIFSAAGRQRAGIR